MQKKEVERQYQRFPPQNNKMKQKVYIVKRTKNTLSKKVPPTFISEVHQNKNDYNNNII